jgi:hypothetical protein
MRCLAWIAFASLAACTDAAPYMTISDASGTIAATRDDAAAWSTGNTSQFVPPGTLALPEIVTLRIEGRHASGDYEVNDPLSGASVEIVEGSACRVTAPLECAGGVCFVELELTQTGLCMVRGAGVTRDGIEVATCWFRGTWEDDGADPQFAARMEEMTAHVYDDCVAR